MSNALYSYSGSRPQQGQARLGAPGTPPPAKPKGGVWGSGLNQRQWERTWQKAAGVQPTGKPAPGPNGGTPAASAKPSAPDPRDATYWAQRAKLLSQNTQDLAGLEQAQAYQDTDFAEAMRRRALQRDTDQQQIKQGANHEGLLFSGQLGKRQGDYDVQYAQQTGDAQQAYERAKAERAPTIQALRSALQSGMPLDEAALYAESIDRQLERDAANPPNPYEGIDFNALSRLIAAQKKAPKPKRKVRR